MAEAGSTLEYIWQLLNVVKDKESTASLGNLC